jgi:hypothetical protein
MTAEELTAAAKTLFGERGYSVALATALNVHPSQTWRYLNGRNPIPGPVVAAVEGWLKHGAPKNR